MVGRISKVAIVEVNKPPTTTIARGLCTSEPGPVAIIIGIKLNMVIEAVIKYRTQPRCTALLEWLVKADSFLSKLGYIRNQHYAI